MATFKTQHYWAIHAKVTNREWRSLDTKTRDVIASDSEHTSYAFRAFKKFVEGETERLYNDSSFYYNDPYSFRYSRH